MPLDPEAKMKIIAELQKRDDITPEQHQLLGRMWVGQLEKQDKPLVPQDPVQTVTKGLDAAGQVAAETLAEKGANPYVSAAIGTGVAMAPDLAGAKGVFKPAAGMVKEGTEALGAMMGKGLPGEAELLAAKSSLRGLPSKYAAKEAALEELSQQAGKEIGVAQSAKDIGMVKQGIPSIPKDMNDFANGMRELSQRSPDELAKAMDIKGLQKLKDTITVARQAGTMSPAQNAMVSKAADVLDAAIGKQAPEIGEGLSKFRTVADAKDALKNEQIVEKMRIQNAIDKIRKDMRMSNATKVKKITAMIAKAGASGAAAALGWHQTNKHF